VAIVTGAASGIGKEIALVFAREGAKIAIADLDQRAAEAAAQQIDASSKRAIGVARAMSGKANSIPACRRSRAPSPAPPGAARASSP
jgi:NAD(P)-dependent dehydrogenase (short-subunit alcohol dehydrogenase family)